MEKNTGLSEIYEANDKKPARICAVWDFRSNETVFDPLDLLKWMKTNTKKFVFQKECGDSGYIHWQGRFSLIKKRNKQGLIKLFGKLQAPNYLEPTATINHNAEFFYAMKEDTRIGITYMDDLQKAKLCESEVYVPRQLVIPTLYPFQQSILDSADNFSSRTVNVLITAGNDGKSTVANIADIRGLGVSLPTLNNMKEMIQMLCNICKDTNNRQPRLVFLDMPRSQSKQELGEFYSGVEIIKNGKLFDCRHHYKQFWIDSPAVWIFTNTYPDTSYLSTDRWHFWTVNDKKELTAFNPTLHNFDFATERSFSAVDSEESIREIPIGKPYSATVHLHQNANREPIGEPYLAMVQNTKVKKVLRKKI